jgi:hypothetical protein
MGYQCKRGRLSPAVRGFPPFSRCRYAGDMVRKKDCQVWDGVLTGPGVSASQFCPVFRRVVEPANSFNPLYPLE